jgi:hypothetical protein
MMILRKREKSSLMTQIKRKHFLRKAIIPLTALVSVVFLGGNSAHAQVCGGGTSNNCWTISPTAGSSSYIRYGQPIPTGTQTTKSFTITFTWTSTDNTPSPSSVVLRKQKSGSAFTGVSIRSFSTVPEYEVKNAPGTTFTVDSGNMTVTNQSPNPSVSLGYLVQIANPVISLTGTTKIVGKDNILIGQGCAPSLGLTGNITDALILDPSGYTWTASGNIFDSFTVNTTNGSTGQMISCPTYDNGISRFSQPNPRRWIWRTTGNSTVTGGTNVYVGGYVVGNQVIGGTNLGSVTANKSVVIQEPTSNISATTSSGTWLYDFSIIQPFSNLAPGFWIETADYYGIPAVNGIEFKGVVTTPTPFLTAPFDVGKVNFVQIVTPNRVFTSPNGATPNQGLRGLDTAYPYNAAGAAPGYYDPLAAANYFSANGTTLVRTIDSPGELVSPYKKVVVNEPFEMYVMYRPPVKPGLDDSWVDWVTIQLFNWNWTATAQQTQTGTTSAWLLPSGPIIVGSVTSSGGPFYAHPNWQRRNP